MSVSCHLLLFCPVSICFYSVLPPAFLQIFSLPLEERLPPLSFPPPPAIWIDLFLKVPQNRSTVGWRVDLLRGENTSRGISKISTKQFDKYLWSSCSMLEGGEQNRWGSCPHWAYSLEPFVGKIPRQGHRDWHVRVTTVTVEPTEMSIHKGKVT